MGVHASHCTATTASVKQTSAPKYSVNNGTKHQVVYLPQHSHVTAIYELHSDEADVRLAAGMFRGAVLIACHNVNTNSLPVTFDLRNQAARLVDGVNVDPASTCSCCSR